MVGGVAMRRSTSAPLSEFMVVTFSQDASSAPASRASAAPVVRSGQGIRSVIFGVTLATSICVL
jgi:hypothetical protein